MARSALVDPDGKVTEFVGEGSEFPVHEDFHWEPAPDQVQENWTFSAGAFTAPPAPAPRPPPEDTPTRAEDIARALIAKGTLTATDIANAKKTRP